MNQELVKVSVEVRSGTARFRVGVQAENIRRALSMVGGRYPRGVVRVVFANMPKGLVAKELSVPTGVVGYKQIQGDVA
ncbi:MAG TPA: hypothetical protein VIZ60_13775 [Rubrobacter sp.]